ncbi:MAG: DUF2510 domain-containing protein [Candidatus Nanopelagicales bacterium]
MRPVDRPGSTARRPTATTVGHPSAGSDRRPWLVSTPLPRCAWHGATANPRTSRGTITRELNRLAPRVGTTPTQGRSTPALFRPCPRSPPHPTSSLPEIAEIRAAKTPPASAANWYPDPCARHEFRCFDGKAWTQQVSDAGRASVNSAHLLRKPEL